MGGRTEWCPWTHFTSELNRTMISCQTLCANGSWMQGKSNLKVDSGLGAVSGMPHQALERNLQVETWMNGCIRLHWPVCRSSTHNASGTGWSVVFLKRQRLTYLSQLSHMTLYSHIRFSHISNYLGDCGISNLYPGPGPGSWLTESGLWRLTIDGLPGPGTRLLVLWGYD